MASLKYDNYLRACLAFSIAMAAISYLAASRVKQGRLTIIEASQLIGAGALVLGAPALIARVAAVATGYHITICSGAQVLQPSGIVVAVVQIASWATLLCWVWGSNGAGITARALQNSWNLVGGGSNAERANVRMVVGVRLVITVLVCVGLIGSIAITTPALTRPCTAIETSPLT